MYKAWIIFLLHLEQFAVISWGEKTSFKYSFKQTITFQREYIIPKTYNFNLSSDANTGILTFLHQLLFKMLPDISILHLGYRV